MPWLYHKYAGHDLNRDAFMMNMAENRNLARFFYTQWHPQVFLTMHQMGVERAALLRAAERRPDRSQLRSAASGGPPRCSAARWRWSCSATAVAASCRTRCTTTTGRATKTRRRSGTTWCACSPRSPRVEGGDAGHGRAGRSSGRHQGAARTIGRRSIFRIPGRAATGRFATSSTTTSARSGGC